ncbi:hypothetical protein Tco_0929364 [Tanacetum coccineum]
MTFSNPLFDSNDDFTSSDDETLSDEGIPKDNVKIYSNPLFEFNDEYISSDVNPLFDEVLENIECKVSYDSNLDESTFLVTPLTDSNEDDEGIPKDNVKIYSNPLFEFNDEYISSDVNPLFDEVLENIESTDSYVSNLDESTLLVTPLFDSNEDEFFTPGNFFDSGGDIDEIDAFLDVDISTNIKDGYHDSEGDILYLESLLSNDIILSLPPEVFLDHDPRSLSDINDLKIMVKDCPDYEDSRAYGFVHRSLDL